MKKPKRPRLKKNPEIPDYIVEHTHYFPDAIKTNYKYFMTRADARFNATDTSDGEPGDRVRIFRAKFTLVSDLLTPPYKR